MTWKNPRLAAVIDGWPMGMGKRGQARFMVEAVSGRGVRVVRETRLSETDGWRGRKVTTYASEFAIVDGDDGRTWLLSRAAPPFVTHIIEHSSNMQHSRSVKGAEEAEAIALLNSIQSASAAGGGA